MCHYPGTVLVTPHLRGPRHLSHDGQQNVGGGHVGGGLTGWHCPEVQTPQGNLFSTNCQSISEGATRDSASEVQGQKLSSEAREDEEEENDRHRGGGVIHHLAPPPGMILENWYYCVEL